SQCISLDGVVLVSSPIKSMIRRQHASPVGSPSAANSSARLALSSWAVSPYHQSIRKAARQMSISVIIPRSLPALAYKTVIAGGRFGRSPARIEALEGVREAADVSKQFVLQPSRGADGKV